MSDPSQEELDPTTLFSWVDLNKLGHLSTAEIEIVVLNPILCGEFIRSYQEPVHDAKYDTLMEKILSKPMSAFYFLRMVSSLAHVSRDYRHDAIKIMKLVIQTIGNSLVSARRINLGKMIFSLGMLVSYESDENILKDIAITIVGMVELLMLKNPEGIADIPVYQKLLVNNIYNKHPNLRKLFCRLLEYVPSYFLRLFDSLVGVERNNFKKTVTTSISNFLRSPDHCLKLCAIRAAMSFLYAYYPLVVVETESNKLNDEFGSLALIAMKSLLDVAMYGSADEHHELCAILKRMADSRALILSMTVIRTVGVMNYVSLISNLPSLSGIAKYHSIRLFVRITADYSSQHQVCNTWVNNHISNFCVFLINMMSQRDGEPQWDPEGIDDVDERVGAGDIKDIQMGEANREGIQGEPRHDQAEKMEEDDQVDLPPYLFAYNQLESITSNIDSGWIFMSISRQVKRVLPCELYALFLAANLLTRGFTLQKSLDDSARKLIDLGIGSIQSSDHRVAWSAATLLWEVGIKLQELESTYLSTARAYVQGYLQPLSKSHSSTRVRARMLKALQAFS